MEYYAFDQYQKDAKTTALYKDRVVYPTLGLCGETGEVAEKIKKRLRDHEGNFDNEEFIQTVTKELGDVLWYVANLAADLNINLSLIAKTNIEKLASRKERNKLQGSGDER